MQSRLRESLEISRLYCDQWCHVLIYTSCRIRAEIRNPNSFLVGLSKPLKPLMLALLQDTGCGVFRIEFVQQARVGLPTLRTPVIFGIGLGSMPSPVKPSQPRACMCDYHRLILVLA